LLLYNSLQDVAAGGRSMDPIDRMVAWGGAGLLVGMMLLSLVALVTIPTGRPSESLLRNVPGADTVRAPIDNQSKENNSAVEPTPIERQSAVAAVEATPAPARPTGIPSPTPIPARTSIQLPTTLIGSRVLNETPLSPPPAALPTTTPRPSAPPAATPRATPAPLPTPLSTPLDACLQAETVIATDHNRLRIERGSLISYEAGVLVLATADGPVSLVITLETQVIGDLAVATQVRVEAHLTGSGRVMAKLVEVLCPQG
jgi:hypothetical protein